MSLTRDINSNRVSLFDGDSGVWKGCRKEEEGACRNDIVFN